MQGRLIVTMMIGLSTMIVSTIANKSIELIEGELYLHGFNDLMFQNSGGLPYSLDMQEQALTDMRKYDSIETEQVVKKSLTKNDGDDFVDVKCSLHNSGAKNLVSLIYRRSDSSKQSRFYIEVKEVFYHHESNYSKRAVPSVVDELKLNLTQQSISSSTCTETVLINEFNRVLLVCVSSQNNQFYMIMLCSDNSCSEVSETLKITEYQRNKNIESMRLKKMPGVTNSTFSFLIYFENTPNVEYMMFDNNGNIDSTVYTLPFNITMIRYFSGQLLVVEGVSNSRNLVAYSFFDFGIYRLNFDKIALREMNHFGTFANSFVSSLTGEIVVELLIKETLVDLSLDRKTYEFAVEFSKTIHQVERRTILLFEIGGNYQLVGFGSENDRLNLSRFMIINQHKMINASDVNDERQTVNAQAWTKVQGFYQLAGCRIDKTNPANWTVELFDVHFNPPFIPLTGSPSLIKPGVDKNGPFKLNIKANNGTVIDTISVTVRPKINYRIDKKQLIKDKVTLEYDEVSTDDHMPLDSVIIGNFIAIKSLGLKNGQVVDYKNKINPLLVYHTLEYTNQTSASYDNASSLVVISTLYSLSYTCQALFYLPATNSIAVYEAHGRSIDRVPSDLINMGFTTFEPFNETVFVAHSDKGLFLYDTVIKRPQELVFDSGVCKKILLLRHSKMDLTIWCMAESATSVYYARDLIEGRNGIRKLPLSMDEDISQYLLETSDHFPDFIFALDKRGYLLVFKIDANSNLLVQQIGRYEVSADDNQYKSVAFKFQSQYLMIYQTKRIGYGYQIVLQFYFFKNPLTPIKTKDIELDFIFTPNMDNLQIFKMQRLIKYSTTQKATDSIDTLAIPVIINGKHHNVIFVDPKATKSRSIPFTLFTMDSEITRLTVGVYVHGSSSAFKFGISVYYTYIDTSNVSQSVLATVSETTNTLRLTTRTEGNIFFLRDMHGRQAISMPVNVTFEYDIYRHDDDRINVQVNHRSESNSSENRDVLMFATRGEMRIDMETVRVHGMVAADSRVNATLVHLIDVARLTTGNVVNWSISVESYLESVSNTIKLKGLIRNKALISSKSIPVGNKYRIIDQNCTNPSRSFITLELPNSISKRVGVDIYLCMTSRGVIVLAKVHDPLVMKPLYVSMSNRLPTSSSSYVKIQNNGYLLEVISLRRPHGRKVFSDFYLMDFSLKNVANQSMGLRYVSRKFLSESSSEYVTVSDKSKQSNMFEIYEWYLSGINSSAYDIGLRYEQWKFDDNKYNQGEANPYAVVRRSSLRSTIDAKSLRMDVFDLFEVTTIDADDQDSLWFIIEHSSFDSYLLKFDKKAAAEGLKSALTPIVWRVDNPLYGFDDNAFELKSQKSDWLMVSLRIIADECYLVVYILPSDLLASKPLNSNNTIYSKEVASFRDVVDFTIEESYSVHSRQVLTRHDDGQLL